METTAGIGEESRISAVLESLGVASILLDLNDVVTHLNEPAALILGIDREQILGRSFY